MSHVTRRLPAQPHLDVPKREARDLQKQWRAGDHDAFQRIRAQHPRYASAEDARIAQAPFRLSDAQLVVAREYGFNHWTELKQRVESNAVAQQLSAAIRASDRETAVRLVQTSPYLLHIPVMSGHWGPPMSHAANLGRLEIVQAMAALGARDLQHAFDRAVLQGRIDCARWLFERGAKLEPGIVMGPCETLNAAGLRFLAEIRAPFTDHEDNRFAPLAMLLETYSRFPAGKHESLEVLAQLGYALPDTPVMAFHRGRVDLIESHLRRDPTLLERRFSYRDIYPPELGCHDDGRSGLHGTPVHGTTLLHLAIDFDEQEIFDLLLARGADVNAPATIDAEGFGGHTPLFNAVVSCAYLCGRQRDAAMAKALLARGALPNVRANLRKFLDWRENPGWHLARNVTPAEWGETFPEKNWANPAVIGLLRPSS